MKNKATPKGRWLLQIFDINGVFRKSIHVHNMIVNEGLQQYQTSTLLNGTQIPAWYMGIMDASPTISATDTLASHAGWTEVSDYSGDRPAFTGVLTGQTATNDTSQGSVVMSADVTLGGVFLASVSSGTTGILFSAGALDGGDETVSTGETVYIKYEVEMV